MFLFIKLLKELIVLTDALKSAVVGLNTAIDGLALRQPNPFPSTLGGSVDDKDVQAAIDSINTATARLDKLVNPATQSPAPSTAGPVLVPASPTSNVDLTPLSIKGEI